MINNIVIFAWVLIMATYIFQFLIGVVIKFEKKKKPLNLASSIQSYITNNTKKNKSKSYGL